MEDKHSVHATYFSYCKGAGGRCQSAADMAGSRVELTGCNQCQEVRGKVRMKCQVVNWGNVDGRSDLN